MRFIIYEQFRRGTNTRQSSVPFSDRWTATNPTSVPSQSNAVNASRDSAPRASAAPQPKARRHSLSPLDSLRWLMATSAVYRGVKRNVALSPFISRAWPLSRLHALQPTRIASFVPANGGLAFWKISMTVRWPGRGRFAHMYLMTPFRGLSFVPSSVWRAIRANTA